MALLLRHQAYRRLHHVTNNFVRRFSSPPGQGKFHYAPQGPGRPLASAGNIVIEAEGLSHSLSPVLMRDLCHCPQCVDPSTRQKHFSTADIPRDIAPTDCQTDDGVVRIRWENDVPGYSQEHQTEVPLPMLHRLLRTGQSVAKPAASPRVLWDAHMYNDQARDFSFDSYMKDDSVLIKSLRQLHTHGLLFLTNVPGTEESVEMVAERIGPLKTTFYGRTWDVRSVPDSINVAYTAQNLGFHMDLLYMKQPPHLQLLHCIRSSAAGGASLFTDSFKAVQDLFEEDPRAFEVLSTMEAAFHYDHPGSQYYHQSRNVIESDGRPYGATIFKNYTDYKDYSRKSAEKGAWLPSLGPLDFVDAISWSPPFQAPFALRGDSFKAPDLPGKLLNSKVNSWTTAARKFNRLIHRPDMIYERMMKPGECVIFDNRRVLHARRAFEVGDAGKERWLRGAYIDKDPYLSKIKILNALHDTEHNTTDDHFESKG